MSQDDLPPSVDHRAAGIPPMGQPVLYEDEAPRRLGRRGRVISWIAGIAGLILLVLLALWLSSGSSGKQDQGPGGGRRGGAGGPGGGARQPTTVGTVKATTADLPVQIEALGTVTPAATVTVRPQVSGTITQILYREGQLVRKGQTLAVIDPRPYHAALLQAQGALIRDRAQRENAQVQLQRYDILLKQDSIARQDRDTQAALVHQLDGTIAIDRGQVQQAEINLGYTRVISPVSGRVGLKVVDIGNYIAAGDTNGLVVVTTLQPIDVEFAIPQDQAPAIAKRVAQGAEIPTTALDRTRTQTLDTGTFSTLDNRVDTTTGTIKGKARFENTANQLYPSQFVNVRLTVDTVRGAIVVPPSAVRSGQNNSFVWLLKPDRTVTQRVVTTGVTDADHVQIVSGLAIGDTVITDGGDRLSEGGKVALPGDKPTMGGGGWKGRHGHHRRHGSDGQGGGDNGNQAAPVAGQTPAQAPTQPAQQPAPAASPSAVAGADQSSGFPHPPEGLTPEQRHAWFQQQMANMTPEQREAWRARRQQMRQQRDGGGQSGGGNGG